MDKVKTYFIDSKENDSYIANFRDIPETWVFVEDIPKNTMGKHAIGQIALNGIDGTSINLHIDADNMGVKNLEIVGTKSHYQKVKK